MNEFVTDIFAHKGYTALIWYSEEDNCFIGQVIGLNLHDISFHGDTVIEAQKNFNEVIDFYLETTEKPERPVVGRLAAPDSADLPAQTKSAKIINFFDTCLIPSALSKSAAYQCTFQPASPFAQALAL